MLDGNRVFGCEQLLFVRHLQIQLVKHHWQSFLPLQIDSIQKRLLGFRDLVEAVPGPLFLEAPIQMVFDVAIDNANAWRPKPSRKAGCGTRQAGLTLRRYPPFRQRRLKGIYARGLKMLTSSRRFVQVPAVIPRIGGSHFSVFQWLEGVRAFTNQFARCRRPETRKTDRDRLPVGDGRAFRSAWQNAHHLLDRLSTQAGNLSN